MITGARAAPDTPDLRELDRRRTVLAAIPLHWAIAADRLGISRPATSEGWLIEARQSLAHAASLSKHDASLTFARLAEIERGIAAAINAYVMASDPDSAAKALNLLGQGLRASGQDYAARTLLPTADANERATSAPRIIDGPDLPPAPFEAGGWALRCDSLLHCTAILAYGDAPILILERAAGPGTPLIARLIPSPDSATNDSALTLQVGRRRQLVSPAEAGNPFGLAIPSSLLDALVARIAEERDIGISAPAQDRQWQVPTTGGANMLAYIDRLQQREGHSAALVLRGRASEAYAPLAPTPREVRARRVAAHAIDDQLPTEVRDFWHHSCSEASMIARLPPSKPPRITHLRLDDGTELWLLPCRSGPYGMLSMAAFRFDGNLQALTLPYHHKGIEPKPLLLEQAVFVLGADAGTSVTIDPSAAPPTLPTSAARGGLLFLRGRGADQPPSCMGYWVWTGRWFERVLETCSSGHRNRRFEIVTLRHRILTGD
jgi:hypothetical protein